MAGLKTILQRIWNGAPSQRASTRPALSMRQAAEQVLHEAMVAEAGRLGEDVQARAVR